MRKNYLVFFFLALTTGCNAGSSPSNAPSNVQFHIVTTDKKVDDPSSPVGYWEISLSYPQLDKATSKEFQSINKQIAELVNKYSCQQDGDKTFTADPVSSNGHVLSFYYEAMWMCSTMPSPDSTSGTVSYNLDTGKPLAITNEFKDEASHKRFLALANQLLDNKLKKQPSTETSNCHPYTNANNALIDTRGIELKEISKADDEADCPVSVLIPKDKLTSFFKPDSVVMK